MAINNVESTLPDPKWVAAVEKAIADLQAENSSLKADLVEARR